MPALTLDELSRETGELLPRRETLELVRINITNVVAVNTAIAVNAASVNASAVALANQWISTGLS